MGLRIWKGVSHMTPEKQHESLTVKAGGRTYFFDVLETKEGKPFLTITESRYMGKEKERERKTITVFQEHVEEFSQKLYQMVKHVKP